MKQRILVIGLLGLALGICRLPMAAAEEEHEQKEGTEEHEQEEGKAKIPDTVAGILAKVKAHEQELGKTIADKKLDKVHAGAFAIRDMVNALPDKSQDLPAEKLAKVKANAKFVDDLARRLDESGDANDQAGTEANFQKLQGILKTLESLYPPDALKHAETRASAHGSVYICPMHPGVAFDKPGKCPTCGMTLALKK